MIILKAKLQKAVVTQSCIDYLGSITIDEDLMDKLGVIEYEQCIINGLTNRNDITYVIKGERGSGIIGVNGALSTRHKVGDHIHVLFFDIINKPCNPKIVETDKNNKFIKYLK